MNDKRYTKAILDRLARVESRLVEGFMQLGADVKNKPSEKILVDNDHKIVYIPHPGVSIGDVLASLPDTDDYIFDVKCGNEFIGAISKE